MIDLIEQLRDEGDSVGGILCGCIRGLPAGLGEPVFDKFAADLGKAMLSINAVKGFEFGSGFAGATMRGSEHNDQFYSNTEQGIRTLSNFSGGTQGGITNGEDVYFRVAMKPVSTIVKRQKTLTQAGKEVEFQGEGRHDPCVLPRAVPIVDAMAALVVMDHYLRHRGQNGR